MSLTLTLPLDVPVHEMDAKGLINLMHFRHLQTLTLGVRVALLWSRNGYIFPYPRLLRVKRKLVKILHDLALTANAYNDLKSL